LIRTVPGARSLLRLITATAIALTALGPTAAGGTVVSPAPHMASAGGPYGAWVKNATDASRLSRLMGRPLTSTRVYFDSVPGRWSNAGVLRSLPTGATVSLSFLRGTPVALRAFLAGHPAETRCYVSYFIEPEPVFTTAARQQEYRRRWASYAPAIRAAGCIPMLVLRSWTMYAKSGRDWRSWYAAGSIDALGFDAYNLVAVDGIYPSATDFLAPFIAASRRTGLPWAMPEIGSFLAPRGPLTSSNRAAWAHQVAAAAARDPQFRFADWWDAVGADASKDFTMDQALARAWHS